LYHLTLKRQAGPICNVAQLHYSIRWERLCLGISLARAILSKLTCDAMQTRSSIHHEDSLRKQARCSAFLSERSADQASLRPRPKSQSPTEDI
jgi:hypothetical protein